MALGAADDRVDARDQLVLVEGLGHVIVGAEAEATDLGVDVGVAGEDEDRCVDAREAQLLQHVVAVHVGQGQIQQDDVVIIELAEIDAFLAQIGRVDIEPFRLQHQLDALGRRGIVLDQQYPHLESPMVRTRSGALRVWRARRGPRTTNR